MTSLEELGDQVAARTPAPGAGAVTAHTAALAAALAQMVARFSDDDETSETCERLRRDLLPLPEQDAEAYERYLAAVRLPAEDDRRQERMAQTLSEATDIPMRMAELAAEVATHAGRLAREGNRRLHGDAVTAALVAAAATRSAAALVRDNMRGRDDPRTSRASELATGAQRAADAISSD